MACHGARRGPETKEAALGPFRFPAEGGEARGHRARFVWEAAPLEKAADLRPSWTEARFISVPHLRRGKAKPAKQVDALQEHYEKHGEKYDKFQDARVEGGVKRKEQVAKSIFTGGWAT